MVVAVVVVEVAAGEVDVEMETAAVADVVTSNFVQSDESYVKFIFFFFCDGYKKYIGSF
jgi:hypothetical protein